MPFYQELLIFDCRLLNENPVSLREALHYQSRITILYQQTIKFFSGIKAVSESRSNQNADSSASSMTSPAGREIPLWNAPNRPPDGWRQATSPTAVLIAD
jgi:hypothetical protein